MNNKKLIAILVVLSLVIVIIIALFGSQISELVNLKQDKSVPATDENTDENVPPGVESEPVEMAESNEDDVNSDESVRNYDPHSDIKLAENKNITSDNDRGKIPDNCKGYSLETNNKRVSGRFDDDNVEDSVDLEWIDKKTGELLINNSRSTRYKQFIYSRGPAKYVKLMPVVKGEKLKTACGNGYRECQPGEPTTVRLKYDGFIEYNCALNSSYLYEWDRKAGRFKVISLGEK